VGSRGRDVESWLGTVPHTYYYTSGFCIYDAYRRVYEHGGRKSLT